MVLLKRVAQWCMTKLFTHMAQLDESPHNQNRIHDGQESGLHNAIPCPQANQVRSTDETTR